MDRPRAWRGTGAGTRTGPATADRGQVGIGTLVVLIAMILVAATTAGIFFEIAGSLQGDTASASADTSDRLSGQLEILTVTGKVRSGGIESVEITVKLATDSGGVDLRDATIQWIGPNGADSLVWAGRETGGATFGIEMVKDDDDSGPILNSEVDRAVLTIDTGLVTNETTVADGLEVDIEETGPPLRPTESAEVTIVTDGKAGYRIQVPVTIEDGTRVGL